MKLGNIFRKQIILFCTTILLFFTGTVYADGFIVIPRPHPHPHPFPLEVVFHRVNVDIDGQFAVTSIDQAFYNPSAYQLEGYYLFPIPKGAVIKDFRMLVNGLEMSAELLDAEKARKLYEDIVRNMRDPALLEYSEQGLFKVRIFPIEPRSEKKVFISYREVLQQDNGLFEYIYPLNTEKFSAKPLKDVSINVEIKSDNKLKTIYCPTQEVDIIRSNDYYAKVGYEEENVKPDIDFKLYYSTDVSRVGMSLLSYREPGDDGYFFLSLTPALNLSENEINDKDITFILDVSGSMAGDKLKQAKKALIYCIENLNNGDKFEFVRFSTEAYALFKKTVDANKANKEKAIKFINELNPIGGTNIEEAFDISLSNPGKNERPHIVVFITDGKPTIGETDEDNLVNKIEKVNSRHSRIFTFGIGNEINTHLLDKITSSSKATRTYISPSEDIELKISQFYDKVQSPALTDIELAYGNEIEVYQSYPGTPPDLFRGSNLTIFGRYRGDGNTDILLTGILNGREKEYNFEGDYVRNNDKNDFIPPLWAARRIGHLLDLIRLHGESKEMIDEVATLARTHGIVTPYTSYLIMEDETVRVAGREIDEDFQTLGRFRELHELPSANFRSDFESMKLKSGEGSVRVSEEFRDMNKAENLDQMQQGSSRMNYQDKSGVTQNLAQQVKNIMGRAVYQTDKFWVDSQLQSKKPSQTKRVQFATEEYFELFNKKPEAAQFLALGQNVRFVLDDTFYEIYE